MADGNTDSGFRSYAAISIENGWNGVALTTSISHHPPENPIVAPRIEQWREWLRVLVQDRQQLPRVRVLKTSRTVEVLQTEFPRMGDSTRPSSVICKQNKMRGAKDAIAGLVRSSPARRNFERARALHNAGIGTALPLAYLERKSPRGSWLVTEFLEDVIDLDAYVLTVLSRTGIAGSRSHRNAVIQSLSQTFRGLQKAGLYHRDMKASNILLAHTADQTRPPRVCIVDLDGLAAHRPWRSHWKPIERLAASLMPYSAVTRTDYARFLREYLIAGGQDRRKWRTRFPRLRKKAARYAQAAQKRKSNKLDGFTGNAISVP